MIRDRSDRLIELSSLEIPEQEFGKLSTISNLWEMMYEIGSDIVRNAGGD